MSDGSCEEDGCHTAIVVCRGAGFPYGAPPVRKTWEALLDKTNRTLDELIRTAGTDPFQFGEIVSAWNDYFQDLDGGPDTDNPRLEQAVDTALLALVSEVCEDVISPKLRRILDGFSHPTFVVRRDGIAIAVNEAALRKLDLDPGDSMFDLGLSLNDGRSLSEALTRSFDRKNSTSDIEFMTCLTRADQTVTIACVRAHHDPERSPTALIFVIDPVWRNSAEGLLARAFGLSDAETEILMAFLEGINLRDIAAARGRSLATVRTQFQSVMTKMGARTQAELMRNAFALSQFLDEVDGIAEVATHPFRRKVDLLRPGGRSVEVVFSGDMNGDLVVFLTDITQFTFQASLEARFEAAGLCVASLCRPGKGATSPPPADLSYEDCLAGDIVALLDQMEVPSAKVLAHNLSTAIAYRMGGLIADRISQLLMLSTLVPRPFLNANKTSAPWASALMRAMDKSPTLFRMMMHAGLRAWKVLGTRRFNAIQLGGYPPDVELASAPETDKEFDAAMRMTLSQGGDYSEIDLRFAVSDWSDWVADCKVPVTLVHGVFDQVADIEAVRRFAKAFEDKVKLIELDDAGFMTFLSHTEVILSALTGPGIDKS